MSFTHDVALSTEAIRHQMNDDVIIEFERIIQYMRDNKDRFNEPANPYSIELDRSGNRVIKESGLLKFVHDNWGIDISVGLSWSAMGPSVLYGPIDGQHVFSTNDNIEYVTAIIQKLKRGFTVTVDASTGKISGDVPDWMHCGLVFSAYQLFRENVSSKAIAATMLHEIGHIVYYYLFLGVGANIAQVLQGIMRVYTDNVPETHRVTVLEELDLRDADDLTTLSKVENKDIVITMYLKEYLGKSLVPGRNMPFNKTSFEALSDSFATRYRGGVGLAEYLIAPGRNPVPVLARISFILLAPVIMPTLMAQATADKIAKVINNSMLVIKEMIMGEIMLDDSHKYESDFDRVLRIRRDIIDALKDKSLSRDNRQMLLKEIEDIDKYVEMYKKPKLKLYDFDRIRYISKYYRNAMSMSNAMNELERLASNEIHVSANRLQQMRNA